MSCTTKSRRRFLPIKRCRHLLRYLSSPCQVGFCRLFTHSATSDISIQTLSVHAPYAHRASPTIFVGLHCLSLYSSGSYRLRSADSADYVLPRTRTKFGEHSFSYSGASAWNSLPSDLHDTSMFSK